MPDDEPRFRFFPDEPPPAIAIVNPDGEFIVKFFPDGRVIVNDKYKGNMDEAAIEFWDAIERCFPKWSSARKEVKNALV